ncbi:unnamed protein product [Rangifer tarandus platyrhynchus]|uniref:Uncharacterized protein n=1 Tax=Rangifer tarandus platyrhynchus TaxID=3082113 RepID=A0AC59YP20_RANTA
MYSKHPPILTPQHTLPSPEKKPSQMGGEMLNFPADDLAGSFTPHLWPSVAFHAAAGPSPPGPSTEAAERWRQDPPAAPETERPCARPRKTERAARLRARSAERRNGGAGERSAARAGSGPAPGAHRSGRAARAAPAAGSAAPAAGRRGAAGVGAPSPGRPDGEAGRPEPPPRAGRFGVGLAEFPAPRASPGLGPRGKSRRRSSDSRRAPGPSLWDARGGRGSTHEGRQNLRLFSKGSQAPCLPAPPPPPASWR